MEYVSLGKIINVRGLKGEVKIKSSTDFASARYKVGNEITLSDGEHTLVVHVASYHNDGMFDYVIFKEIDDVDKANAYREYEVLFPKDNLKVLKDAVYYHDLIGSTVMEEENEKGKVIDIKQGAQPLLTVQYKTKNVYIPFVPSFIEKVDIKEHKIYIKHWEGLFDEN